MVYGYVATLTFLFYPCHGAISAVKFAKNSNIEKSINRITVPRSNLVLTQFAHGKISLKFRDKSGKQGKVTSSFDRMTRLER